MPRGRWAPYLPWSDDERPVWRRWPAAWRRLPATLTYAAVTTTLFSIFFFAYGRRREEVPRALYAVFVYEIPQFAADPVRSLVNLLASAWMSYHPVQLVYVLALLAAFGAWFELREGTFRWLLVFFGGTIGGALLATTLLHAVRVWWTTPFLERAWSDNWTGGSAGCFALLGAMAARTRRPLPFLGAILLWEANIEYWHLRSYTPAFHLGALATGYALTRFVLRPRDPPTAPPPAPDALATLRPGPRAPPPSG